MYRLTATPRKERSATETGHMARKPNLEHRLKALDNRHARRAMTEHEYQARRVALMNEPTLIDDTDGSGRPAAFIVAITVVVLLIVIASARL